MERGLVLPPLHSGTCQKDWPQHSEPHYSRAQLCVKERSSPSHAFIKYRASYPQVDPNNRKHYADLMPLWRGVKYVPMVWDQAKVKAEGTLVLEPK